MQGIMLNIAVFLKDALNVGIIGVGIIELFVMLAAWVRLAILKKDIGRLNRPSGRKLKSKNKLGKRLKKEYTQEDELDWEAFDDFCDKYQKDGIWYTLFSMIIQLFPLLGILGTVAGLYVALGNMESISQSEQLLDGVKFALSSTILGIGFAIFFKLFDIIIGSVWVDYIDDGIVIFQNNYREESTPAGQEDIL